MPCVGTWAGAGTRSRRIWTNSAGTSGPAGRAPGSTPSPARGSTCRSGCSGRATSVPAWRPNSGCRSRSRRTSPRTVLHEALALYRRHFEPSEHLAGPHAMVGVNVFAADTDAEARRLFTSVQQQFLNLIRGTPGLLPPPVDTMDGRWSPPERAQVERMTRCSAVGSPAAVQAVAGTVRGRDRGGRADPGRADLRPRRPGAVVRAGRGNAGAGRRAGRRALTRRAAHGTRDAHEAAPGR